MNLERKTYEKFLTSKYSNTLWVKWYINNIYKYLNICFTIAVIRIKRASFQQVWQWKNIEQSRTKCSRWAHLKTSSSHQIYNANHELDASDCVLYRNQTRNIPPGFIFSTECFKKSNSSILAILCLHNPKNHPFAPVQIPYIGRIKTIFTIENHAAPNTLFRKYSQIFLYKES